MRLVADQNRCVGAGACVVAAPDVFEQNDVDGRVVVRVERPEASLTEDVIEAVDICPGRALSYIQD